MKIEFSTRERQVMTQLIDIAIKSGGLQVAQNGLVMAKKLNPETNEQNTKSADLNGGSSSRQPSGDIPARQ